jgi:hypothetical protein
MRVKPEIKYGLLGALLLIIWTLAQFFAGFHTYQFAIAQYTGYGNFLIVFICLWFGLKEKSIDYKGKFTVRRGVKESMYQLFITASVSSLFMFLYDYKINPLWVEEMVTWQRQNSNSFSLNLFLANDPHAEAIILSNSETHLCLYFLGIVVVGTSMAFMISAMISKTSPKNA